VTGAPVPPGGRLAGLDVLLRATSPDTRTLAFATVPTGDPIPDCPSALGSSSGAIIPDHPSAVRCDWIVWAVLPDGSASTPVYFGGGIMDGDYQGKPKLNMPGKVNKVPGSSQ